MKNITLLVIVIFSISCKGQDQKEYTVFLKEITTQQNSFKTEYLKANTSEKKIIITKARRFLTQKMATELFPY